MQSTIGTAKYGMATAMPASADHSAAANGAVTSMDSHLSTMGADNPAVWLAGIGAVVMGLVAFSTSVRVGSFRAGVSAGS